MIFAESRDADDHDHDHGQDADDNDEGARSVAAEPSKDVAMADLSMRMDRMEENIAQLVTMMGALKEVILRLAEGSAAVTVTPITTSPRSTSP